MKKERKDIFWYLSNNGTGMETFYFETHDDAYNFGSKIRDNEGDKVVVEINYDFVRVRLVEQEALVTK